MGRMQGLHHCYNLGPCHQSACDLEIEVVVGLLLLSGLTKHRLLFAENVGKSAHRMKKKNEWLKSSEKISTEFKCLDGVNNVNMQSI